MRRFKLSMSHFQNLLPFYNKFNSRPLAFLAIQENVHTVRRSLTLRLTKQATAVPYEEIRKVRVCARNLAKFLLFLGNCCICPDAFSRFTVRNNSTYTPIKRVACWYLRHAHTRPNQQAFLPSLLESGLVMYSYCIGYIHADVQ